MATRAQAQIACTHHDMWSFQEQTGNLERGLWMLNHGPCPQTFSLHVPLRFSFAAKGGLRNVSLDLLDLPLLAEQLWLAGSARSCKTKNRGAERCRAVQSGAELSKSLLSWFLMIFGPTGDPGDPTHALALRIWISLFCDYTTSFSIQFPAVWHVLEFDSAYSDILFQFFIANVVQWCLAVYCQLSRSWFMAHRVFCGSSWIIGWFAKYCSKCR